MHQGDFPKQLHVFNHIMETFVVGLQTALQWLLTGSGPLASSGCENGAFLKTSDDKAAPDLQVRQQQ